MSASRDYAASVAALERSLCFGIHPSLDGIEVLTAAMGYPESSFASAQITGTNGKTSVTRLLSAVLRAHGMRTGTYTSPHLIEYAERIEVDGRVVMGKEFARAIFSALDAATATGGSEDTYTEFEILTAAALDAFRAGSVDWACLEVGMGGRWDATSVVSPRVSVITGVALDHTDRLGTTRAQIAADKAFIIKPGATAVLGPGCAGVEDVLIERACQAGSPIVRVGLRDPDVTWAVTVPPSTPGGVMLMDVHCALRTYADLGVHAPSYQAPNVAVALAAAEAALGRPLDAGALRQALGAMTFPGRFQVVRETPLLIIDGAHNPQAAGVLADAVRESFGPGRPVFLLGAMADKDVTGIVAALAPVAVGFVCTASRSDRALAPEALAGVVRAGGGDVLAVEPDVPAALAWTGAAGVPAVIAAGSIYIAGEVLASAGSELT
ncbi:MAG: Mur ligase family protein [Coriobacteriia bacterium]